MRARAVLSDRARCSPSPPTQDAFWILVALLDADKYLKDFYNKRLTGVIAMAGIFNHLVHQRYPVLAKHLVRPAALYPHPPWRVYSLISARTGHEWHRPHDVLHALVHDAICDHPAMDVRHSHLGHLLLRGYGILMAAVVRAGLPLTSSNTGKTALMQFALAIMEVLQGTHAPCGVSDYHSDGRQIFFWLGGGPQRTC
jgi:hypothetical protein